MLAKLICLVKGHKRGKRVGEVENGKRHYSCPRCKARWSRKAKA
jgi:hypothetical protein